ncbi:hypothetical protein STVA_43060 [Allostella vacuolata]|nr:hypothetical protein STVA_43060 [Stella vacuolata]
MIGDATERRRRARAALDRRDFAAARAELEPLVAAEPGNPEGHGLLGAVRAAAGDHAGAAAAYATALRLRPGHGPTAHRLGATLLRLNAAERARAVLAPAAAAAVEDGALQATYAAALLRTERCAEAADAATRATAHDPGLVSAWITLAAARRRMGDLADALAAADQAVRQAPRSAPAHLARAAALLALGRFEEGWAEQEWQWPAMAGTEAGPATGWWDGRPVAGRIAIRGDLDPGEQLWASAFLPGLVRAGHRLVLECAPPLLALFRRSFPDVEVVAGGRPDGRLAAAGIAAETPLSRLPAIAWRRHRRVGRPGERLVAEPVLKSRLRIHYREAAAGRRIVGLARHGRPPHGQSADTPLSRWGRLLDHPDLFVVELPEAVGDFDALAAQVAALDGVVAVPGPVVATALAVGTPLVVAVDRFHPDWRYPIAGEDSPWLPGARLLRSNADDGWDALLERIVRVAAE